LGLGQGRGPRAVAFGRSLIWQMTLAREIGGARQQHQDTRATEPDVPSIELRKQAAGERPDGRADIDARAEDRERSRTPRHILWRIEMPDLRRDISLKATGPGNQQQ